MMKSYDQLATRIGLRHILSVVSAHLEPGWCSRWCYNVHQVPNLPIGKQEIANRAEASQVNTMQSKRGGEVHTRDD